MADKKDKATIIIKKIQPAAHGGHGGAWKVAYADFVTAMMAFFLVMWLMGTDEETKAAVEGYFKSAGSPSALSISPTDPKGGDKIDQFQERSPSKLEGSSRRDDFARARSGQPLGSTRNGLRQ
jgi:flagellar motor protein MotB